MVQVPYTDLSGQAAAGTIGVGVPDDYQRLQVSGDTFGAQVGQADQKLGGTLQQAGDQVLDLHNKVVADDTSNQLGDAWRKILTGDPNNPSQPGYLSLQGKDALAARASTAQQLQDTYDQFASQLNPVQKLQFDQENRRYMNLLQGQVNDHAIQQGRVYQAQTQQATIQNGLQNAGQAGIMGDDNTWNAITNDTVSKAEASMRATGAPDEAIQEMRSKIFDASARTRVQQLETTSPVAAQSWLQANQQRFLPNTFNELSMSLAPKVKSYQAAQIGTAQVGKADAGYNQFLASTPLSPGGPTIGPDQIDAAIHGQESGGAANAATSDKGAIGGGQIMPATFAQYAKPGEDINNPVDNAAVRKRIITDYSQKFNNDPARVAVAYFSGPGNVSPAGSPTPYLQDKSDGHVQTSAYVAGVLGRLPGAPTKADYYRTNMASLVQDARTTALAQFPDDPQYADLAAARTQQQLNQVITQQDTAYKADSDILFQAANGDLAKGVRPATIDAMTASNPQVLAAWNRVQSQQPQVAHAIATRFLQPQATGDARTLGAGFADTFNRIHAPDGDPNKVTDEKQLYSLVNQPGGLTMEGLAKARQELAGRSTPDGEAEGALRSAFFKNAHAELSGTDDGLGLKDPKGEQQYLRFMAQAYPAIAAAKTAGKTPAQIYNPDSPDYVGKLIAPFKRSLAQRTADMLTDTPGGAAPAAPTAGGFDPSKYDLTKPDGIVAAYKAGMPRAQAEAAAAKLGYTAAQVAPPAAPSGPPQVPTVGY